MIIKSHIRGGYRSVAEYMKDIGKNEKTRVVELSDPSAKNLDEAFHNMWVVASNTRCTKPLHHISINPMKDERLTDEQVLKIVERCEEKYGYKMFHHQRVIVEHIKDGRQHFHVIWNRVSLVTGSPVWPGHHWNKSKQVAREMEKELGLKRPEPKRMKRAKTSIKGGGRQRLRGTHKISGGNRSSTNLRVISGSHLPHAPVYTGVIYRSSAKAPDRPFAPIMPTKHRKSWPIQAVIDWEVWGHRNPRRFFALWPELSQ